LTSVLRGKSYVANRIIHINDLKTTHMKKPNNQTPNHQIIVGLDIGTTKIVAMAGQKNENGKIEVLGVGKSESHGVAHGEVVNIEQTTNAIKIAIKRCEEACGININEVNVGIAGQHIRSQQQHGSKMRANRDDIITRAEVDDLTKEMLRICMDPSEQIIQVVPQFYRIDNQPNFTKEPVGAIGTKLEGFYHVIMGKITAAQSITRCVKDAGLKINLLILEPIASSVAVLSPEEKEAGVVLVDIGGGTTDVAIFHDNILRHTAVIPFGGNIITDDIVYGCSIIRNYAEKLKIECGSAMVLPSMDRELIAIPGIQGRPSREITVGNLARIINARMEEILETVVLEIEKSGYKDRLGAGIVITGGGANLGLLKQLTELKTTLDARIGHPTQHIAGATAKELNSPVFATSVGLMMLGFDNVSKEVEITEEKQGVIDRSMDFLNNLIEKLFQE
jgi:cell division protein FtsA